MALPSLAKLSPRFAGVAASAFIAASSFLQTGMAQAQDTQKQQAAVVAKTEEAKPVATEKAEATKVAAATTKKAEKAEKAADKLNPLTLINFHEAQFDAKGEQDHLAVLRKVLEHPDAVVVVNYRCEGENPKLHAAQGKTQFDLVKSILGKLRPQSEQPIFLLDVIVAKEVQKDGEKKYEMPWLMALSDALENNELGLNGKHIEVPEVVIFTPYTEVFLPEIKGQNRFAGDLSLRQYGKKEGQTDKEFSDFVVQDIYFELKSYLQKANERTIEAKAAKQAKEQDRALSLAPR